MNFLMKHENDTINKQVKRIDPFTDTIRLRLTLTRNNYVHFVSTHCVMTRIASPTERRIGSAIPVEMFLLNIIKFSYKQSNVYLEDFIGADSGYAHENYILGVVLQRY